MICQVFMTSSADEALLKRSKGAVGSPFLAVARAVEAKALQVTEALPFLSGTLVPEFTTGEETVGLGIVKPHVTREGSVGSSVDGRAKEKAWIRSHSEELSQFADEWIVVEGEQLIAHDPEFASAAKKARAQGVRIPYVTRIHSLGTRLSIGYQWKRKRSV